MKTSSGFSAITAVTTPLFGIIAVLLVAAIVFKIKLPFLESDPTLIAALVAVAVLGHVPAVRADR